MTTNNFLLMP